MDVSTRQWVIKLFALTTALICAGIAGVLVIRVAVDGNAPLTEQITAGFINQLPQLLGFLAAVIVGEPVVSTIIAKVAGVAGVLPVTTTLNATVAMSDSSPAGQPEAQAAIPAQPTRAG